MEIFTEEKELRKFISEKMKLDWDKLTIERIIEISKMREFLVFKLDLRYNVDFSHFLRQTESREVTYQELQRLAAGTQLK